MSENSVVMDKVSTLGSDTIMGATLDKEMQEAAGKLQDAIEEQQEVQNEESVNTAVVGNNLNNMVYYQKTRPIVRDYKKVGRNDLCPCGSGKKFKNCCMNTGKYDTTHYE